MELVLGVEVQGACRLRRELAKGAQQREVELVHEVEVQREVELQVGGGLRLPPILYLCGFLGGPGGLRGTRKRFR